MSRADDLYAIATRAWPREWVDKATFAAYVADRTGGEPGLTDEAVSALYLAHACVSGVTGALEAFDRDFFSQARSAASRVGLTPDQSADLLQNLRESLIVGKAGGGAKLREYRGKGDLRGWLRVTATRAAIRVRKKVKGAREDAEDDRLEARAAEDDPELGYMKALYRQAFRAAVHAAVAGLDAREKKLLFQHTVEGMSIDQLGEHYEVHRATAARWIQAARERLLTGVRRELAKEIKVSPRELNSILKLVQSRFDVTMRRLLA